MMQSDLPDILRALQDSENQQTQFSETWTQGRSAYGGLSAAIATAAMNKQAGPELPMRSLMVSFIAPIPAGPVSVIANTQRRGKNVVQMGADLMADGQLSLQTMAAYGRPRPGLRVEAAADFNPLPREQGVSIEVGKRTPAFLAYFEGCWAGGGVPFSGRPEREVFLWAKHRCDMSEFPTEKIIALADIPPPVLLSHFDTPPVPASSLSWSLEFLMPAHEIDSEWFYLEFTLEAAAEGYTQQSGRIFTEDGKLCALSRQCMVYFGPPEKS